MGFLSAIFHRQSDTDVTRFNGYVDHHSHILPGVDDGFRNMDDAVRCLATYEQCGFREVWLTPHIMEDFPNTTDDLRRRYDELVEAYHGTIKLNLASENMIDTLFVERLGKMDLLPMGDRLLVETSYFNAPENFNEIIDEIMHKGFRPLLAHPERYRYMTYSDYDALVEKGVELQLNVFSLVGMYGEKAKEKAHYLLSHGAYTLSGTDVHNLRQPEALRQISKDAGLCRQLVGLRYKTD